ncbi:MAG: cysteine desulfurase, partial [Cyclobacteriaceae bacterium]
MKKVYFDSAATTQLRSEVVECITNILKNEYGNPSSSHAYGR